MKQQTGIAWISLGLLALAFAVRLACLLQWSDTPLFEVPIGDGRGYLEWAQQIVAGNWLGSEVFYQAPFYPYFLALLRALFGESPWVPRIAQLLLGSLSCVLLALAGRRFFSVRTGAFAGLLLALYAPAIYYDGLLQKACLALFFSSLLLFVLGELQSRPRRSLAIAAGIVLGCFSLVFENALLLVPVVAVWVWLGFGDVSRARVPRWVVALALGTALVLVPVGLRNQAIGGRFLLTTSQAGPNFYIGNHDGANGRYLPLVPNRGSSRYEQQDARELAEQALGSKLRPGEISGYWWKRSLTYIRAQPLDWLALLRHKSFLVLHTSEGVDTDSFEAYRDASSLLDALGRVLSFGVLAPLAALGLLATRRHWRRLWLLYGLLLAQAASIALFYVLGRYRAPLVPPLALFASAGVLALVEAAREARWRALAAGLALLAAVATISNWPLPPRGTDPRAITWYALGLGLIEAGRDADALPVLSHSVEVAPRFSASWILRGHALRALRRLPEAIDSYRAALEIDPRNATAHAEIGLTEIARGNIPVAIESLQKALEIDPDHADANNSMGNVLIGTDRVAEAIDYYEKAAKLRPNDPALESNLAVGYARSGDLERALVHFDHALALDPGNVSAFYNRAGALERLGRRPEAFDAYQRLSSAGVQLSPAMRNAVEQAIARLSAADKTD